MLPADYPGFDYINSNCQNQKNSDKNKIKTAVNNKSIGKIYSQKNQENE